jgi:hypothetical protein
MLALSVHIYIREKVNASSSAEKHRDLNCLKNHPEFIVGNPDDLVHIACSTSSHIFISASCHRDASYHGYKKGIC